MKKPNDNYLDYVFKIKEGLVRSEDDSGQVTVDMENKGFTNRVAQRFFNRPAVSHIRLEGMGSFIFKSIDGERTVYDIGQLVKAEFGEKAEPLYERLCTYMKQLEKVRFIERIG